MAIDTFTELLEIDPRHVGALYDRGLRYIQTERYEEALADYDAFVELEPELDGGYFNRGRTHFYLGNYELAIQDFESTLELNAGHEEAPHWLEDAQNALEENQ